ncbi:MAG: hypothetical protein WBW33_00605 [Bryobacteraceae bacterium]
MREYRLPLDMSNPGQFFACCGLFEIADLASGGSNAWFERDEPAFVINTPEILPPQSMSLCDATGDVDDLKLETLDLCIASHRLTLNWWRNETETDKSVLKTWGGQQTPRRVLGELLGLLESGCPFAKLFETYVYTESRFGVDSRSAWEAIDAGYSPTDENQRARTFPWVEVLAVIGLQGFRPEPSSSSKFRQRYNVWLEPLTLTSARAAVAAALGGLKTVTFEFEIAPRGQGYKTFLSAKGADHV